MRYVTLLIAFLWLLFPDLSWGADRPNILFILADDLGWKDTSLYGSEFYRTPNIDSLAVRGMMFTEAYSASPLCSPTRASILTGQNPGRLRLTTPACHLAKEILDPKLPETAAAHQKAVTPGTRTRLPNDYVTYAEVLKPLGYATCFAGKRHLGHAPYLPDNQGFDVVIGGRHHPGPPGGYFAPWPIDTIPKSPDGAHIDDVITTEAVKFIRRNKDRPWLLNLWFYSVHAPFEAKADLIEKYRGRVTPDYPQRCPTMGAMIQTLDDNIGRVMATVDDLGLAQNTIIVFTSDNGGNMYNTVDGTTPTNNSPLRSGKGNIHEGGVRVPLIVIWPGHVEPGSKNTQAVVSTVDWFPTLAEMIGFDLPTDQPMDGVSLVPPLKHNGSVQRDGVFVHFPHYVQATGNLPSTSVRDGDWKLIRFYSDGPNQRDRYALYRVGQASRLSNPPTTRQTNETPAPGWDIGEQNNVADQQPELVKRLTAKIDRFLRPTQSLVPKPNPNYSPDILGWRAVKDAKISKSDTGLSIQSTGRDPILEARFEPLAVQKAVIRLRTSVGGKGQLFWRLEGRPGLGGNASFDAPRDGKWHNVEIAVDRGSAKVNGLRLDPCSQAGHVLVESVRLLSHDGAVLRAWEFQASAPTPSVKLRDN